MYDPDRGKMHCPYCDGENGEEKAAASNMGICPGCGAEVEVDTYASAGKCVSCGNYLIFEERVGGDYKPHLILPFQLGWERVKQLLTKELSKKTFLPGSFFAEAKLKEMEGMYIPFWLYDYSVNCDFAGRGEKVKTWIAGGVEYTETSVYGVERNMDIDFERVPVDASLSMEDNAMDLMEPYEYKALEDFQEKYMSGFFGEVYNQASGAVENRAREKVRRDTEAALQDTLKAYTRVLPDYKNMEIVEKRAAYALMPVWIYHYHYKGKQYPFHINGQTGKIVGTAPVSIGRVFAYSGGLFALLCVIMVLAIHILEVL